MKLHYYSVLLYTTLFACSTSAREQITVFGQDTKQSPLVSSATRTATPVKLIPQMINTVSARELTAFAETTLSEALAGIPGVNARGDTRFDGLMIRGFSAGSDFYLDGFRDDMQYTRDLTNTDRVEILKGPAAVLYGRGSSGGMINRISKKPGRNLPSSLRLQAGSYDFTRLQADLNAQLTDDLLLRVNGAQEDKHSFRHGVKGERRVLAPSVSWQINSQLNWLAQYEFFRHKRTPDRGIPGVNGRPAPVDLRQVYSNTQRDYIDDNVHHFRSRLTYDINYSWQLRQLLAFSSLSSQFDNTYVTAVRGDKVNRSRWQQDMHARNLISNLEAEATLSAGIIEHRLLFGMEQSWQTRKPELFNNSTAIAPQNLYQPQAFIAYNDAMQLSSHSKHQVRNSAFYVQEQLSLDNWHVLAGLRYDRFHVTSTRLDKGLQETRDNNHMSPRLGLVWNPLTEHAVYISYSKSYLPTGGSLIGITPGNRNNILPPEQVRQYETGIKSDWLDGRLATMLSLYRLEMYNRRTADAEMPGVVRLIGLQRTDGIELSTSASLTSSLYLRAGIALQNARLIKAENHVQGKRPASVSRQNGSLYIGYRHAQGWFTEAGITAAGKRYADNANTTILPGYYKFDARAGYSYRQWDLQLSVDNLLDNAYYLSATSASQIMPGSMRQINLSAGYRF